MDRKNSKRILYLLLIYAVLIVGFYFIGDTEIRTEESYSGLPSADNVLGEISEGTVIEQQFRSKVDEITKITLNMATYARTNRGLIVVSLVDTATQTNVSQLIMDSSLLADNSLYEWQLDTPVKNALDRYYTITIGSECPIGEAPTLYWHNGILPDTALILNGEAVEQTLCFSYAGRTVTWFGSHYWFLAGGLTVLILVYLGWFYFRSKHGRSTILGTIFGVWDRYRFLIHQLVSRDFKTKYKRSVLGYLWSFLNPLLTMIVQYIVFSTIFRSDIKNFPVYLLSGIILFNFFTDAVGQGLSAIVNNASLITKVYVPKYIYPVTKVISSSINLIISVIPLFLVALLTGAPITKALLLLPFGLLCLIAFSIGMALALSSAMVFFRDTQYLWGIISLAWMYATPLFYPENIIPEQYRLIQKLNPMYYIVKFVRTLMIDGVSPEPVMYVYCLGSALLMLVIGAAIFKKTQDRFVLYI